VVPNLGAALATPLSRFERLTNEGPRLCRGIVTHFAEYYKLFVDKSLDPKNLNSSPGGRAVSPKSPPPGALGDRALPWMIHLLLKCLSNFQNSFLENMGLHLCVTARIGRNEQSKPQQHHCLSPAVTIASSSAAQASRTIPARMWRGIAGVRSAHPSLYALLMVGSLKCSQECLRRISSIYDSQQLFNWHT
jgi:hypothetical protein